MKRTKQQIQLAKYKTVLDLLERAHEELKSIVKLEGEGRDGQYFQARVAELLSSDDGECGLMVLIQTLDAKINEE